MSILIMWVIWIIGHLYIVGVYLAYVENTGKEGVRYNYFMLFILWPMVLGTKHTKMKNG